MNAAAQLATPAQINYLRKLDAEYHEAMVAAFPAQKGSFDTVLSSCERSYELLTKRDASKRIDIMKPRVADARRLPKAKKNNQPVEKVELEDGIYFLDGQVIKVIHAVHGSGNQYAKVLDTEDLTEKGNARFVYAPGLIKKLTTEHKMTREQAVEFGTIYGVCSNCGRTLTAEESIERAIGPVCAGKFV